MGSVTLQGCIGEDPVLLCPWLLLNMQVWRHFLQRESSEGQLICFMLRVIRYNTCVHSHQKMAQQWLHHQTPSCSLGCCMQCLAAWGAEPGTALKSQASPEVLCAHGAGCRVDLEDDLRFLRLSAHEYDFLGHLPLWSCLLTGFGSHPQLALPLWYMGIFYPNRFTHIG